MATSRHFVILCIEIRQKGAVGLGQFFWLTAPPQDRDGGVFGHGGLLLGKEAFRGGVLGGAEEVVAFLRKEAR